MSANKHNKCLKVIGGARLDGSSVGKWEHHRIKGYWWCKAENSVGK